MRCFPVLIAVLSYGHAKWSDPHAPRREDFGSAIMPVGDLDGGGVPELAVALRTGSALYSGETGAIRWRSTARATSFAPVGDFDGDGVRDLVAAWIELEIVSGATGAVLGDRGCGTMFGAGLFIDALGDGDGDGFEELLVESVDRVERVSLKPGAPRVPLTTKPRGSEPRLVCALPGTKLDIAFVDWSLFKEEQDPPSRLRLLRTGDGSRVTLATLCTNAWPPLRNDPCAWGEDRYEIAPTSDVDGDGRADVLVATLGACVRTISTHDGAVLATFADPMPGGNQSWFGGSIVSLGDLDGDRIDDVAVGCRDDRGGVTDPFAAVFSGRTGARLALVPHEHGRHDHIVAAPGDVDRDGRADLAVLVPACGSLTIYSGKDFAPIPALLPPNE